MKKLVVVGFSLLAVGLVVLGSSFPALAQSKELTLQTYGAKQKSYTDTLSEGKTQEFKKFLVELQARLNNTNNLDEEHYVFNEALVKIKNLGLLPRGMTLRQAQDLVFSNQSNRTSIIGCSTYTFVLSAYWDIYQSPFPNLVCIIPIKLHARLAFGSLGWVYYSGGGGENPAFGWIRIHDNNRTLREIGKFQGRLGDVETGFGWNGVRFYIGAEDFRGLTIGGFPAVFYLGSCKKADVGKGFYP
jgi:hypothetical protein